jgi:hypothetical protein
MLLYEMFSLSKIIFTIPYIWSFIGTPEEQREVLELLWDFSIEQEEKEERLASECENE